MKTPRIVHQILYNDKPKKIEATIINMEKNLKSNMLIWKKINRYSEIILLNNKFKILKLLIILYNKYFILKISK